MYSKLKEQAPSILRVLIYATLILTPIAFLPKGSVLIEAEISYIEAPKVFLFRILTSLMLPLVVANTLNTPLKRPSAITISVFIFLVWTAITVIFSSNPRLSFWGEFFGQDGYSFISLLHYVILFIAVTQSVKTREEIFTLFRFVILAGTLASSVIIVQEYQALFFHAYTSFPSSLIPDGIGRPPGTFGNPVFAGSFLLLTSIVTIYWFFETKQFRKRLPSLIVPCVCVAANISALINTETRGALAGLAIFSLVYGFMKIRKNKTVLFSLIGLSIIAILFVGISGGFHRYIEAPNEIQARIKFWKGSIELVRQEPIFGVGPEMFRYHYLNISPTSYIGLPEEPDHAHSWYFHHLAETGIPGAIYSSTLIILPIVLVPELAPMFLARVVEQTFGVARISDIALFYILLGVANAYRDNLQHNRSYSYPVLNLFRWICSIRLSRKVTAEY